MSARGHIQIFQGTNVQHITLRSSIWGGTYLPIVVQKVLTDILDTMEGSVRDAESFVGLLSMDLDFGLLPVFRVVDPDVPTIQVNFNNQIVSIVDDNTNFCEDYTFKSFSELHIENTNWFQERFLKVLEDDEDGDADYFEKQQ